MSLRDQLASRPRRRVVVSLSRPEHLAEEQRRRDAAGRVVQARAAGEAAAAADLDALTSVTPDDAVEFAALEPAVFEALQAKHTKKTGELDTTAMRPELLAACATDESLQDPAWWAEVAKSGAFTHGDLITLWQAAYAVNAQLGSVGAPKG